MYRIHLNMHKFTDVCNLKFFSIFEIASEKKDSQNF